MKVTRQKRKRRGFTLMEVLLVMAILIILASLVTVGYQTIRRNSQRDGARTQIQALEQACKLYFNDVGVMPQSLQDLRNPPQGDAQKWRGPYLEKDVPKDPWGGDYQFDVDQDTYGNYRAIISSWGPDRQENTDDDVSNQQDPTQTT